jgi:hypothetical protein
VQHRCCTAADITAATAAAGTATATSGSTETDDMATHLEALASKLQAVDVAVVEPALTELAEPLVSEEVRTTVLCTAHSRFTRVRNSVLACSVHLWHAASVSYTPLR